MTKIFCLFITFAFLLAESFAAGKSKTQNKEPDYTKGEKLLNGRAQWSMGPIGFIGRIWTKKGHTTTKSRMILVDKVYEDTPAAGKLKTNDVILGIISPRPASGVDSDNNFNHNPPEVLSNAIMEAEKKENGGKLVLKVWSNGKVSEVPFQLKVLEPYSSTAPYNCKKTAQLINDAAEALVKGKTLNLSTKHSQYLVSCVNGLGLLATGEEKYWPKLKKMVKQLRENYKGNSWYLAYQNLFLCEYFLATKDKDALPLIEEMSMKIAKGRSAVGTWSHGMANPAHYGGQPYGIPSAYGAMNQVTLTLAISLVLAQKCGIKNEIIDTAVKKSSNYLRYYVDKGSIPYGDHAPADKHDNNGSSSQAAILFSLLGDKEAAEFFTRMSLAAGDYRGGHTGNFFGHLWGPIGSGCGGKYAISEYSRVNRWTYELTREADGNFCYHRSWTAGAKDRYTYWSETGARLLWYCLPRKQLYITGKGGYAIEPFPAEKANRIVEAQNINPKGKSQEDLVKLLHHWSPRIRRHAAKSIGDQGFNVTDQLLSMLSSENRYARYGAAEALRFTKQNSEAVNTLIDKLNDPSMTMRYYAIKGTTSTKAIPHLLKLVQKDFKDEYRPWTKSSAVSRLHGGGSALINESRWKQIPLEQRIEHVKQIVKIDNGGVRSAMSSVYQYLTKQEMAHLLPVIYKATEKPAPSGVMFGKTVRANGIRVMAEHHIKEGINLALSYIEEPGHGIMEKRKGGIIGLVPYGPALPEEFILSFSENLKKGNNTKMKKRFRAIMKTPKPKLISIEEFIKKYHKTNK